MALAEDLINFDIIEAHKENVPQLPGGRSARQLAAVLSPMPTSRNGTEPTLEETKTLNGAIRQEYETELRTIDDSDDPLDIYDRYVRWTMNAYPSAQATPQSQLLPTLERATKAFLTTAHYKNDPRYLKLWLTYIRFFSDAPRETFAFLARHNIGEGLGLFYEEFAAWLENAKRWSQADEVYRLGIEREARPAERLSRKYAQFQKRFEARPQSPNEPSSPALPTVRAALATKIDPFASASRAPELQGRPQNSGDVPSTASSRIGKPKMTIFQDADGDAPPAVETGTGQGWDSIGSLKDRKKENAIEARPWTGETLSAGKKTGAVTKMEIFRDQVSLSCPISPSSPSIYNGRANDMLSWRQQARASRENASKLRQAAPTSGPPSKATSSNRTERAFVNLDAIYPAPSKEFCFEELRAMHRGWLDRIWKDKNATKSPLKPISANSQRSPSNKQRNAIVPDQVENLVEDVKKLSVSKEEKPTKAMKAKRLKIREIKQETQTVKLRLESPTGPPKLRRKTSAEPTMTLHSKAATDDIYNLFNVPAVAKKDDTLSGDETDLFNDCDEDGFSTAGESTGTGRISQGTSECGEEDTVGSSSGNVQGAESEDTSVSPWSEFTASRHLPKQSHKSHPKFKHHANEDLTSELASSSQNQTQTEAFDLDTQAIAAIAEQTLGDLNTKVIAAMAGNPTEEVKDQSQQITPEPQTPAEMISANILMPTSVSNPTPTLAEDGFEITEIVESTKFVPIPPIDYDPTPLRPLRDSHLLAQNRLPYMTPIVERTESSIGGPLTVKTDFGKTPSRSAKEIVEDDHEDDTKELHQKNDSPSKLLPVDRLHLSTPVKDKNQPKRKLSPAASIDDESPTKKHVPSTSPVKSATESIPFPLTQGLPANLPAASIAQSKKTGAVTGKKIPAAKSLLVPSNPPPNPTDGKIRRHILDVASSSSAVFEGFFSYSQDRLVKSIDTKVYAHNFDKKGVQVLDFGNRGDGARAYGFRKILGSGAFATVHLVDSYNPRDLFGRTTSKTSSYISTFVLNGDEHRRSSLEAIKMDHYPRNGHWEFYILRTLHDRLQVSATSESPDKARAQTSIVLAHELHLFTEEVYLVLSYEPQGTLLDLINLFRDDARRAGKPIEGLDETLAAFFTIELVRTVAAIHAQGILHADLKADNWMVRFSFPNTHPTGLYDPNGSHNWSKKGLVLIDFGRGVDMRACEPRTRFMADWASTNTDCVEIREARTWRTEIDWFGVAGIVHQCLFGNEIVTVISGARGGHRAAEAEIGLNAGGGNKKEWKLKNGFKRYWNGDMWGALFYLLVNSGVVMAGMEGDGDEEAVFRGKIAESQKGVEGWLVAEGERGGKSLRGALRRAEEHVWSRGGKGWSANGV